MNDELTCAQIEELMPSYVVDALVEEERCSFLAHLAECRRHDDDMAAYRALESRLTSAIDPVAPAAQVRSSLLRSFDALVAAGAPAEEATSRPASRGRVLRLMRAPVFAYGLAAAFLALAIGLGAMAIGSDGGGASLTRVAISQGNMTLKVSYLPDQQLAVLEMNMPQLPANRTYQAWRIVDGRPVSLGVMGQGGPSLVAFNVDLSRAAAVALSVEPTGGSATPTEVVLALEL